MTMNKIKNVEQFLIHYKGYVFENKWISLTEQNDLIIQAFAATCHSCCLDQLFLTIDVSRRSQLLSAMLKYSTTVTDTAV